MRFLTSLKENIRMRKYNVVLTKKAKKDLESIENYISYVLLEPNISYRLIVELREKITSLCIMPRRCTLVGDSALAKQGIRYLLYKNYYIFFIIFENPPKVVVVSIGYNRRNWGMILLLEQY